MSRPKVADRRVAQWGGIACYVLGTLLIYDAYEGRGRKRPFAAKFLPSL